MDKFDEVAIAGFALAFVLVGVHMITRKENTRTVGFYCVGIGAVLAVIALWKMGISAYIQSSNPGTNNAALVLTAHAVLWIALAVVITRYLRDSSKAESLRSQIITIKDECRTQIAGKQKESDKQMEALRAVQLKQLASAEARLNEVHRIEAEKLQVEIAEKCCRILEQNSEIEALRGNLNVLGTEVEALKRQFLDPPEAPRDAPRLLVEYEPHGSIRNNMEVLVFVNDGDIAISAIETGPLIWRLERQRGLTLFNVLGPLQSKGRTECLFTAFEQNGSVTRLNDLPELLREAMRDVGREAQAYVKVCYRPTDDQRKRFSRLFALSIDPYNRIVFEPGPVRCESGEALCR